MPYPSAIYATVRSRLAGSVKQAIDNEINETIEEICTRTPAWVVHEELALIGSTEYTITPPDGETVMILGVEVDHRPITPWSGYRPFPSNRSLVDLRDPSKVVFSSNPGSTGMMQVTLQLKPTRATPPDIPAIILDRHKDVILDGTLARMFGHQNRPYSDYSMAQFHMERYEKARNSIADLFRRGRTMHGHPWVFPRFAPGSGGGRNRGGFL